jgi:hypothetical protein
MIVRFLKARKVFVFTIDEGQLRPIGIIFDSIINPEKGAIEGFWVKTKDGLKILSKESIREWQGQKSIIIDSEEDFLIPEEAHKFKKIFDIEVPLLGTKVWNRNICVGTLYDFSFDVYTLFIMQIYVSKGTLWWKRKRKIHRSKIVKINENGIFIAENNIRTMKDIESEEIIHSGKAKKKV